MTCGDCRNCKTRGKRRRRHRLLSHDFLKGVARPPRAFKCLENTLGKRQRNAVPGARAAGKDQAHRIPAAFPSLGRGRYTGSCIERAAFPCVLADTHSGFAGTSPRPCNIALSRSLTVAGAAPELNVSVCFKTLFLTGFPFNRRSQGNAGTLCRDRACRAYGRPAREQAYVSTHLARVGTSANYCQITFTFRC